MALSQGDFILRAGWGDGMITDANGRLITLNGVPQPGYLAQYGTFDDNDSSTHDVGDNYFLARRPYRMYIRNSNGDFVKHSGFEVGTGSPILLRSGILAKRELVDNGTKVRMVFFRDDNTTGDSVTASRAIGNPIPGTDRVFLYDTSEDNQQVTILYDAATGKKIKQFNNKWSPQEFAYRCFFGRDGSGDGDHLYDENGDEITWVDDTYRSGEAIHYPDYGMFWIREKLYFRDKTAMPFEYQPIMELSEGIFLVANPSSSFYPPWLIMAVHHDETGYRIKISDEFSIDATWMLTIQNAVSNRRENCFDVLLTSGQRMVNTLRVNDYTISKDPQLRKYL